MIVNSEGAMLVQHDEAPDVATQRKLMESRAGGPVFRIWITKEEFIRANFADWICYELSDGRLALWRKYEDAKKLRGMDLPVYNALMERRLADDVV